MKKRAGRWPRWIARLPVRAYPLKDLTDLAQGLSARRQILRVDDSELFLFVPVQPSVFINELADGASGRACPRSR